MDDLLYLGAGFVVILIIAAILFLRSRAGVQASDGGISHKDKGTIRTRRLDYQPAARPVSPFARQPEARAMPAVPVTIRVVEGRTDIADSTRALAEKHSLTGFTLATTDGLIFSTSGNPTATEDAAQYGGTTPPEDAQEEAGITLFTLTHKGTRLTGIIRSEKILTHDTVRRIASDTQEILNRWI